MRLIPLIAISVLLLLAACGECSTSDDCVGKPRDTFKANCIDSTCSYTPVPNMCGNERCEAGETKGTCPQDCGQCRGRVGNSTLLEYKVVNSVCVEDVISGKTKPFYTTMDVAQSGDKFKIETAYTTPFNVDKDTFNPTITLTQASNKDIHFIRAELTGQTLAKNTITLGTKQLNKRLWQQGDSFNENMILDFGDRTIDAEGKLTNLILTLAYEYIQGTTPKQGTLIVRYKDDFQFVNPTTSVCPANCDDSNPATTDSCGAQTKYFCQHDPIPNTCGNELCDGSENKCTCAKDCGPCSGNAGKFLQYTCEVSKCITILKPEATIEQKNLFDERNFGPVSLNNNYRYNSPFDTSKDAFNLDFKIYSQESGMDSVIIETIRLFEGQNVVAETAPNLALSTTAQTVTLTIPPVTAEEDKTLTLRVWYAYTKAGQEVKGSYAKQLDKLTLLP